MNTGVLIGKVQHGVHLSSGANNNTITNSGEIFGTLGGVTVSAGSAVNVSINQQRRNPWRPVGEPMDS